MINYFHTLNSAICFCSPFLSNNNYGGMQCWTEHGDDFVATVRVFFGCWRLHPWIGWGIKFWVSCKGEFWVLHIFIQFYTYLVGYALFLHLFTILHFWSTLDVLKDNWLSIKWQREVILDIHIIDIYYNILCICLHVLHAFEYYALLQLFFININFSPLTCRTFNM